MYIPGCSCIFTGRWSMLDGLQICENEPNFDSNIIHNIKPGVEKKKAAERPNGGRFFRFTSGARRGGSCLRFDSSKLYIQETGVRQLPRTAPRRAR